MSDTADGNVVVKVVGEDAIFKKDSKPAKPKRKLTDKQKQALQEGRKKAKAKRENELKEKLAKEAKQEAEREAIKKAKELDKKNKAEKKTKATQQETARAKVRKFERDKKIKKWNDIKYSALEKCESEEQFNDAEKVLNTISEDEICDSAGLKKKINAYLKYFEDARNKKNPPTIHKVV